MSVHEQNMLRVLRADDELRHQLQFLREVKQAVKNVGKLTVMILSIRLPFIAHPAYRIGH